MVLEARSLVQCLGSVEELPPSGSSPEFLRSARSNVFWSFTSSQHVGHVRFSMSALCGWQEAGNEAASGSSSDLDSKGVTDAAQAVLAAIDQSELALYFARKTPEAGPEADEARKKAEAKRDALIMTYKTQARTYNALLVNPPQVVSPSPSFSSPEWLNSSLECMISQSSCRLSFSAWVLIAGFVQHNQNRLLRGPLYTSL